MLMFLGSGNSPFAEDMYLDGYKNITCIDYSTISIEQQRSSYILRLDVETGSNELTSDVDIFSYSERG